MAGGLAAVVFGEGIALGTGRAFRSEILRLYTFDPAAGRIVRVRNFYDTAACAAAVRGGGPVSSPPPRPPSSGA